MEIQTFNRKDLLARNWTAAEIKALPSVAVVKTSKRGRPAKLYSVDVVVAAEEARKAAQTQPESVTETVAETVTETVATSVAA